MFFDSNESDFNTGWKFSAPGTDGKLQSAVPVVLPHSWNAGGWTYEKPVYNDPAGTGVYYKECATAAGDILRFEGVAAECKVYFNGQLLHHNLGAYKPFEIIMPGAGLLRVEVTDKPSVAPLEEGGDPVFSRSPRFERWAIAMGSSIKAGGIWRDVKLVKKNSNLLPAVVESRGNAFYVTPQFRNTPHNTPLSVRVFDGDILCSETEWQQGTVSLEIASPVFSIPLAAHNYTIEIADKSQTIRQNAWLFRLESRNSDFYLNGRPYFLRGQNGFPHCNVPYDKEYISQYVSALKEQKVEISRFHTEPPPHAWLDECDRQGIMVILEMPLHGSYGLYSMGDPEFEKNALSEILSIVREYRRHPSIVFWSMGNEIIVACERDLGLGEPLFEILERWIREVRKLDSRLIIPNSNGDAANLVHRTIGDVDDVHQYGGWYVENLYDLRHFGEFTRKNDMLFQPVISTESIAAYTSDSGEFFIRHSDVRQKKVVDMRLGKITDLAKQSQDYQCFLLKEYSEALWRLRTPESSFAGYLPFGQYTWFSHPFEKGPDGIIPKRIWNTYRQELSPVHVQLDCFDRHIFQGETLKADLRLWHEDIRLPATVDFTVAVSCEGRELVRNTFSVNYHSSVSVPCRLNVPGCGRKTITVEATVAGKVVALNELDIRIYPACGTSVKCTRNLAVYDPAGMLGDLLPPHLNLEFIGSVLACPPADTLLLVGPYAMDRDCERTADDMRLWLEQGGRIVVLEQNPGPYSSDCFGCGIKSIRVNQPTWSRWAANLVKHADRSDICTEDHQLFSGLTEEDLFWWNGDTFLAHSYLTFTTAESSGTVLSRIGNGLGENELMPIEYQYTDSGYSITALEQKRGSGAILATSLLIGSKAAQEPVARIMLNNLLCLP